MNPSTLEPHYFDYLTYYEPDGLSLHAYCEDKGISYDEMSAWLEEVKCKAAEKDQEISPEERERINDVIEALIREVREKDANIRELEKTLEELERQNGSVLKEKYNNEN